MSETERLPIEALIERWRVSPSTRWDEIVGHGPQIRRLRELIAKLNLPLAERARLGLRIGAGLVITGPPGSGKSLLGKACARELGRHVIAPPSGELDAERIGELYRALANGEPTVVLIDEAEALVGDPDWDSSVDGPGQRALLGALDSAGTPEIGPVTIALTASDHLSKAATRPGRLAPLLRLDLPTAADRELLLAQAVAGLPGAEDLERALIVERTSGWTGAEIVGLVEEAMTRSLPIPAPGLTAKHVQGPGLRTELVLAVVAERFVVRDPVGDDKRDDVLASRHEAGHCLWAHQTWGPGAVAVVDIHDRGGSTTIADWVMARRRDRAELRRQAGLGFAGAAAEYLIWGRDGMTRGSESDRTEATQLLDLARRIRLGFDEDVLEDRHFSRGSEAMRRARYEAVRLDAANLWDEVVERLRPYVDAIHQLGDAFLAAPGATLSGDEVTQAILAACEASDPPIGARWVDAPPDRPTHPTEKYRSPRPL